MKRISRRRTLHLLCITALLAAISIGTAIAVAPNRGMFVWEHMHQAGLATTLSPYDANLRFVIGNYYFGDGAYDTKKAEGYFRDTLALNPNFEGPHYQLARIYFIRGNFSGARDEINAEISLHPDFRRSYYVRGLINGYSGRLADAESDFKIFLLWKPNSWAGNNDLAWIYFQEGKYIEARDTAREGLTIAPHNPWLLNSLGVVLLNTDDKKGAEDAFLKARATLEIMTEKDWVKCEHLYIPKTIHVLRVKVTLPEPVMQTINHMLGISS